MSRILALALLAPLALPALTLAHPAPLALPALTLAHPAPELRRLGWRRS